MTGKVVGRNGKLWIVQAGDRRIALLDTDFEQCWAKLGMLVTLRWKRTANSGHWTAREASHGLDDSTT